MAANQILTIKTATVTRKGQFCIPSEGRGLEGFKEGSKISIIVYENRIELRPMNHLLEQMLPALSSEEVLAKSWNTKEEDQAWKDL